MLITTWDIVREVARCIGICKDERWIPERAILMDRSLK